MQLEGEPKDHSYGPSNPHQIESTYPADGGLRNLGPQQSPETNPHEPNPNLPVREIELAGTSRN